MDDVAAFAFAFAALTLGRVGVDHEMRATGEDQTSKCNQA
jgi:hypothetical protein